MRVFKTQAEHLDLLTAFMVLSITAPDDEKFAEVSAISEDLAEGLSIYEIESCKARALAQLESGEFELPAAAKHLQLH